MATEKSMDILHYREQGLGYKKIAANTPAPVNFPVMAVSVPGPVRIRRSVAVTLTLKGTAAGAGAVREIRTARKSCASNVEPSWCAPLTIRRKNSARLSEIMPWWSIPLARLIAALYAAKLRKNHSLSAQVSYYSSLIQNHPGWLYCGVYADEALTGTKENRENFQRLLAECRALGCEGTFSPIF